MKMELPENFAENMKELLGEAYPAYIESFEKESAQGIRVNTGKISAEEFQKISPFPLAPVPWTENGFYVTADDAVTKHPYYYAGLYYVQEPSAMLPAALLGAKPGERILDLCAAPGGKATELGSRLAEKGLLMANDVSASRAKALLKNLEQHGIGNVCVCSETPEKLKNIYPEYFDRVLVDAPCSGEGMFRREPAMKKAYKVHGPAYYAPLQREIADAAIAMLRPGGRMVFSTCTFSVEENEETVLALLKKHPEMRLITAEVPGGADLPEKLAGCVRLYPHRVRGEGHFAAVLEKIAKEGSCTGSDFRVEELSESDRAALELGRLCQEKQARMRSGIPDREKPEKTPAQWQEFSERYFKKRFDGWRIFSLKERLYALPPGASLSRELRYLRTGLLLGECRQHGFEPSQALAMFLKQSEAKNSISFAAEDARTVRYLKGETGTLTEDEADRTSDGWTLVCTDGFPLGWAKNRGGMLKNKYYAGWRMQ